MPQFSVDLPKESTHVRIAEAAEDIAGKASYLSVVSDSAKASANKAERHANSAERASRMATMSATNAAEHSSNARLYANQAETAATNAKQSENKAEEDANRAAAAVSSASGIYENVLTATSNFDDKVANARSGLSSLYSDSYYALESKKSVSITEINGAKAEAVQDVENATLRYPKIFDGYWFVWDVSVGDFVNTNVPATGGGSGGGGSGKDGFSPLVSSESIEGGTRLSIRDNNHVETFDILDGLPGTDGTNGVSPTIAVGEISGGHTVTITDVDHQAGQTFNVMDGVDYILTAQDKAEIVDLMMEQVLPAEGVTFHLVAGRGGSDS